MKTTQKRYEFVPGDEITIAPGRTIKRIRALVAIAALGLSPGDCGGYIESETNLSQVGDAWVYDNAQVYGNARVYDNARVYGNAWVYDNARVYGNAWVYGNARVYGDAWVYGDARVYGNALVYGDAWVSGNAQVYGNAWVYGNARVSGDAWVSGDGLIFWASKVGSENGTLTVYACKDGSLEVTRGCFFGSVSKFLEASAAKHDKRTRREYELLIEVAKSRIEAAIVAAKQTQGGE